MTTASAKSSSLWARVATSVVLVPAALLAVHAGGWVVALFATAAGLAMSREWIKIVHHEEQPGWRLALHGGAILLSQGLLLAGHADYAMASILMMALIGNVYAQRLGERSIWTVMGILFIAVPCAAFTSLRMMEPHGFETVVWLLCIVWATDTAAYLLGSAVGGPKLAPRISPNKTWAGAISGLLAAVLAGAALAAFVGLPLRGWDLAASAGVSVLTQCGDMAESFLKRTFGVKDASDLIPGHGGALDRLDGLIVATLGVAGFVLLTGQAPVAWTAP